MLLSCIKNDIGYPKIALAITAISVDGQEGNANISTTDRIVTINLDETADPRNIQVKTLSVTEGATSTLMAGNVINLMQPYGVTLSLYQDYEWTIIGQQDIQRTFSVENQIGLPQIDEVRHLAIAFVTKETKWDNLTLKALKLGPIGATYNGVNGLPNLEWEVFANYAEATVQVKYKTFFSEVWKVRVYRKETNATTMRADGWVNVGWLYGEGLEGADNGFEIQEEGTNTWNKVNPAYVKIGRAHV